MYNIIYADPPWTYRVWSKKGAARTAASHYDVMTIDDIKNLQVASITARDCALFLWVTSPNLLEGIDTLKSWGFTYKTVAFTWVKKNKIKDSWFWGMGHWTRANPEYCLLGTKGNIKRINKGVHSVVDSRIGRHSEKPNEVRDKIVNLIGDLPRIELFAREKTIGWDALGYDIDGQDIRKALQEITNGRK